MWRTSRHVWGILSLMDDYRSTTVRSAELAREHRPGRGDHYRALHHRAAHIDLELIGVTGNDYLMRCHDAIHRHDKPVRIPTKRLRPSWTGRSGLVYLGPWMAGAQMRSLPDGMLRNGVPEQPIPEEGQVWFSMRPNDRLKAIEILRITPNQVFIRRWSDNSPRSYRSVVSRMHWYAAPKGQYGFIYGYPSMDAYRDSKASKQALDDHIRQLVGDAMRVTPRENWQLLDEIL